MLYIDTSVLLVYTLTQEVEKDRYLHTEKFFAQIIAGSLSAATSFYALHEVHVFAIDNAPDFPGGAAFGKAAKVPQPFRLLSLTDPARLLHLDLRSALFELP